MKAAEGAPALKGKAMWQLGVIKGITMRQFGVIKGVICTQWVTVRQLEVIKKVIKGATKGPSRVHQGSSEVAPRNGGIEAHPIKGPSGVIRGRTSRWRH